MLLKNFKKLQIIKSILFLFILFSSFIFAQNNSDPILVEVGDLTISKTEFEDRLYFTPHQGAEDKNSLGGIKIELLYTLIAEKFWANEAINKGIDTNSSVVTAKLVIEKMLVRDELYNVEIKDKINYTDEELKEAEDRYLKDLELYVFFSENEKSINEFEKLISFDSNIESVLTRIDTTIILYKKIVVSFGSLIKETEDILYNLDIKEYSKPIKMETGWNVFYLNNILLKNISSTNDYSEKTKKLVKILNERKEQSNYDVFFKKFFSGKKIDADGKIFSLIVSGLNKIFSEKVKAGNVFTDKNGHQKLLFDSYDLKLFEKEVGKENLEKEFLNFNPKPIKLIDFIRELSFSSFNVSALNLDSTKINLHNYLKDYIKYELLAREGYKRGLNNSPNVTKWVKIWDENFLFQFMKNQYFNKNDKLLNYSNSDSLDHPVNYDTEKEKETFNKFIDATIELSNRYIYKINENEFSKIEQSNINLFVKRNLGFGGSIAGVPTSPPFIEWYLEKKKRITKNL